MRRTLGMAFSSVMIPWDRHRQHPNQGGDMGHVYLWRYVEGTKNFSGWHLTADAEGCEQALAILASLDRERTVAITPPTPAILQVPGNRGGAARWWSPRRLTLVPGTLWRVEASADWVRLVVGTAKVQEL